MDSIVKPIELDIDAGQYHTRRLPVRRGVVQFISGDGRTLLVATTANARAFIESRLGKQPLPLPRPELSHAPSAFSSQSSTSRPASTPHTDLRAIARRVHYFPACSALESDLMYRILVRDSVPDLYAVLRERCSTWWITIEPASTHPVWNCTPLAVLASTTRLGSAQSTPCEDESGPRDFKSLDYKPLIAGPFATSSAANEAVASIVDLFDLCRDERLLVRSPNAVACVYKQLGRCPAPCDGTEPIDSFRARVASACGILRRSTRGKSIGQFEADRHDLAQQHRFEAAGALNVKLQRTQKLVDGSLRFVSSIDEFDWLLAMRGEAPGSTRLIRASITGVQPLPFSTARQIPDLLSLMTRELTLPAPVSPPCPDTIGIILAYLRKADVASSGVRALPLDAHNPPSPDDLRRLLSPTRRASTRLTPSEPDATSIFATDESCAPHVESPC